MIEQDFKKHDKRNQDDDDKVGSDDSSDDDDDHSDSVKSIILDESYWKSVVNALKLMTPVVHLLRLCDGEKPVMGKIYDHMFMIGNRIDSLSMPSKEQAAKIHATRWEYLHSYMHAAGYALNPEYVATAGDHDAATQEGLIKVVERLCLRDVLAEMTAEGSKNTASITLHSDEVQSRVAKAMQELATYQAQEGIFTHAYVRSNAQTMSPSKWWSTYGKHLPNISGIATRVLAQVVCASAAERNWSIYGQI